jgi:hypothetical protein
MSAVLEIILSDDMELDDYVTNFRRMFGDARMDAVLGSVDGSVRFYGLTPTSMKLEGLDRHQRLLDSYKNSTPPAPKPRSNPAIHIRQTSRHGLPDVSCLHTFPKHLLFPRFIRFIPRFAGKARICPPQPQH